MLLRLYSKQDKLPKMKLPKSRRLCKFDPDRLTKSSRFGKSNSKINSAIYPVRSISIRNEIEITIDS